MKIRLAKKADAEELASIHIECGARQVGGFVSLLGKRFLVTYYRLFLEERHSVVLVAEDEKLGILGFSSGTMRAEEHLASIKRNGWRLARAAAWQMVCRPRLAAGVFRRWKSLDGSSPSDAYVIDSGVRGEYWAWRPNGVAPAGAVVLRRAWARVVKSMGHKIYRFEIDVDNSDVEKFKSAFKSRVILEKILPDGRKRLILEEDL